jgi:hypothetical protein
MGDRDRGFDAFASYATDPDYRTVRVVERFLESLHTRGGVRKAKLAPLRICVDGSDFSLPKIDRGGADDPVHAILKSYLAVSAHLILFCSRGAATSSRVDQELAFFLEQGRAEDILCVVTEGADPVGHPEEIFSRRAIDAGLHRVPWYDVRGLRGPAAKGWVKVRDAEDEMVRLAAHLWSETAGAIYPSWQRARARTRRLTTLAVSLITAAALAGGAALMYVNSDRYAATQVMTHRPAGVAPTPNRVAALAASGAFEEAERDIAEMTDSGNQALALFRLANEMAASHPEQAKALYRRVLTIGKIGYGNVSKADVIVHSILAGVERPSIDAFIKRLDPLIDSPVVGWAVEDLAKRGRIDDAVSLAGDDPGTLLLAARAVADREHAYRVLRRVETISPPVPTPAETDPTSTALDFSYQGFNSSVLVDDYLTIDRPDDAIRVARAAGASTAPIGAHLIRKGEIARGMALIEDPGEAAKTLLEAGRLEDAEPSIAKVVQPYARAELLTTLAAKQIANDEKAKAKVSLEQASKLEPGSISKLTVRIASAWAAIGEPKRGAEMLRSALRAMEPGVLHPGAEDLVVELAKIGFVDDAVLFAEKLFEDRRLSAREGILEVLVARRGLDAALAAAKDDVERHYVLKTQMEAAVSRGDDAGLLIVLEKMQPTDDGTPEIPLLDTVRKLIGAGRLEVAARVAASTTDSWLADACHEELATAWAKRASGRAAVATANRVKQPLRRACAVARVAAELAQRNVTSEVQDAARQAASIVRTTNDANDRNRYLECVGTGLVGAHEINLALDLAKSINGDSVRDAILTAVTADLARRGEYKRAKAVAEDIREGRSRDEALNVIIAATAGKQAPTSP